MKKLLTILLLFALAGQVSGFIYPEHPGFSLMQEADDKGKKGGEEKSDKEYLSPGDFAKAHPSASLRFSLYACDPGPSPVTDHLTPPPDSAC